MEQRLGPVLEACQSWTSLILVTLSIADFGDVIYRGVFDGPDTNSDNDTAFFSTSSGLIVREGSQVAGQFAGVIADQFNGLSVTNSGEVFYGVDLAGPGITNDTKDAIVGPNGVVVQEGMKAPGTADGVVYSLIGQPAVNDAGDLAFSAILRGPNTGFLSSRALYVSDALFAREGMPAPGAPDDTVYDSFGTPILNNQGDIAYFGSLRGPSVNTNFGGDQTALFTTDGGMVVRAGDQAAGLPVGIRYFEFGSFGFNDLGEIVFTASLAPVGSSVVNGFGLFKISPDGDIKLLFQEGDTVQRADGAIFTVMEFDFFNKGINNNGDVAISANFGRLDNAILILEDSDVQVIPLPASAFFLLAAVAGLLHVGRKRVS